MPPPRTTADDSLLERDADVAVLHEHLASALAGRGGLVLVEAPAGAGKTVLLRRLRAAAAEAGATTLGAVGGELERDFPFGLVRQLFEPALHAAPPERRERLLAGSAALAGAVVGLAPVDGSGVDATFATLHGLYWLVADLTEDAPLLLVIDDAHWGDAPSLRFLDFLARRAPELPLLVAVGARPSEPGAERELLAHLADAPETEVVRPAPLSAEAVRAVLRDRVDPEVDDEVVAAALATTGGNALLLRELARTLARGAEPLTADAVRAAVPSSVTRSTAHRLGRLAPAAQAVARALAVLGERSDPQLLAVVTALGDDAVAAGLADLRDAELVEEGRTAVRFVHPLLRQAVAESVPVREREELHRSAAEALRARPGAEDEVVMHLLAAPLIGQPWVVERLRSGARRALAEGAPDAAVRRLERALAESADDAPERAELRLELGRAASSNGDRSAIAHFAAAAEAGDPRVSASAVADLVNSGLLALGNDVLDPVQRLREALDRLGPDADPGFRDRIASSLLNALVLDRSQLDTRREALEALAGEGLPGALAHLAFERSCQDRPAADVLDVARAAGASRPLATVAGVGHPTFFWATIALAAVDGTEELEAAFADADATLRRHPTRLGSAFVSYMRAEAELAHGALTRAEAHAREGHEVFTSFAGAATSTGVTAVLLRILAARGALDEADALAATFPADELFETEFGGGLAWIARGELRLAQGRGREAVADLRRLAEYVASCGWSQWPQGAGGPALARALATIGELEEARELAERELALARRRRVATAEAEALLAVGRVHEGDDALEALVAAAEVAAASPSLLLRARAQYELGAALRRAGRRVGAREHLADARDLAARVDATALVAQATEELAIAGARPRRVARTGREALSPSELRVAEHAAAGLSNREIAELLFVTRKTVEFQLGATYSKLGIRSRTQLADALGTGE